MINFSRKHIKHFFYFIKRQSTGRKIAWIAALFAGVVGSGFLVLIIVVWSGLLGRIPGKEELKNIENHAATEIYSADSVLLGRYFIQERSTVKYEQISPSVINALIATEDVRFYDHEGIDYRSLARVLIKSILFQDESSGGGSTVTQQLAKNLYPRKRYWMLSLAVNKIREAITASRLEDVYSKEEILTLYLNTVPFADNTYGIEAAADRFFSTSARNITVEQAAVLVGMLKATYLYNPRIYPKRATTRRNVVLMQMEKYGYLPWEKAEYLKTLPLKLAYKKITHHSGMAPYFRTFVRDELEKWCSNHFKENGEPYNLYTDGLKVYTTVDSRLQSFAEAAAKEQMSKLQREFFAHWKGDDPWKGYGTVIEKAARQSLRYRSLSEAGMQHDEILAEMSKPVFTNVFTWEGEREIKISPLDSIRHHLEYLNTGFLAMEPNTGHVKAWVGGIDHSFFEYDHVRESTKRQVGSVFKPIIYASALERGEKPCTYTSAEKVVFTDMDDWTPRNTEENYDRKYSMEGALAYSVNTVSVKLLEKAGIENAIDLARRMGVRSDIPQVPSIALGTPSVSLLEMITAYSVFANGGLSVTPMYITTVTDKEGNVLENFASQQKEQERVMRKETAQLIIQMLRSVVSQGTGTSLRSRYGITNDIAGKTGTTQDNADGWFIAMSPHLVAGSWVGADIPVIRFRTTQLGQGAHTALPVVAAFYQRMNREPAFRSLSLARFPDLPDHLKRQLDCALFKADENVFERLFGKNDRKERRNFGKKKKRGFFKRLFGAE